MNDLIIITEWVKYTKEDFLLDKEWLENDAIKNIRKAFKNKIELYRAKLVMAVNYCIYNSMDGEDVLIDDEGNLEENLNSFAPFHKSADQKCFEYNI